MSRSVPLQKTFLFVVLALILVSEPVIGKPPQGKVTTTAKATFCVRNLVGGGLALALSASALVFSFSAPSQTQLLTRSEAVTASASRGGDSRVDSASWRSASSEEYQLKIKAVHRALSEAGDRGITDIKIFEPLYADDQLRELWSQLQKEFGYRIVGRVLPDEPGTHVGAMNQPSSRTIVINIAPERFGMVDPSFILVNELWDLDFYHHVLDLHQDPPPFSKEFRHAYDTFFVRNPDLVELVPTDPQANSDFTLREVMSLWMEKRSFLRQYDWYRKTQVRFPEISRAHLDQEAQQTPEQMRQHLLQRFAMPPYSLSPRLSERLWNHPISAEFSYP